MTSVEYLKAVLKSQEVKDDGDEMKNLRAERKEVEALVQKHFKDSSPTIRYGGSTAKGTMNLDSYDLDLIVYFKHDDTAAGDSLEDIYNNTETCVAAEYVVERKTSALRLKSKVPEKLGTDLRIDVVPGRYTDSTKEDAYLYQASGEKKRLKSNPDKHISHVKDSGVIDAIRLAKHWNVREGLRVKTFVLELLVIDVLKDKKSKPLDEQMKHFWQTLKDKATELKVEDPANPNGNDLSAIFNDTVKQTLKSAASWALDTLENSGWESVFGVVQTANKVQRIEIIERTAAAVAAPARPWLR